MPTIPLRKFVLEWRYAPKISFYKHIDEFGEEFVVQFPEWERSALALEVRNLEKHRRLTFTFNRSAYEHDGPDELILDINHAKDAFEKVCKKLSVDTPKRVGLRQWFVFPAGAPFEKLVIAIQESLLQKSKAIDAILGANLRDVAYAVDLADPDGYKFNVRIGPMERDQWFQFVPHEQAIYQPDDGSNKKTFAEFRKTIPKVFFFADIDCFWEDKTVDSSLRLLVSARGKAYKVASEIVSLCMEKI